MSAFLRASWFAGVTDGVRQLSFIRHPSLSPQPSSGVHRFISRAAAVTARMDRKDGALTISSRASLRLRASHLARTSASSIQLEVDVVGEPQHAADHLRRGEPQAVLEQPVHVGFALDDRAAACPRSSANSAAG